MSEKEPKSQAEPEKSNMDEVTRVNSKTSAEPTAERNPEIDALVDEESKYYLTGKRLWTVHAGILL